MELPLTENSTPVPSLDQSDPVYAALMGFARRITKLLTAPAVRTNPDAAGSIHRWMGNTGRRKSAHRRSAPASAAAKARVKTCRVAKSRSHFGPWVLVNPTVNQ